MSASKKMGFIQALTVGAGVAFLINDAINLYTAKMAFNSPWPAGIQIAIDIAIIVGSLGAE